MNDIVVTETLFKIAPRNLEEAMQFANIIAKSDFVPKDFKDKPGNVLVAMQMGAELGLQIMQSLQGIAVINGRPSIWGDTLWALINNHPLCERVEESFEEATMTARCLIKRRGGAEVVRTFSKADAEKARLWGKEGPWALYPRRMLQMRARGFASRDALPEALKGLMPAEEVQDYERDMGDAHVVQEEPVTITMPKATAETIDTETGEIKHEEKEQQKEEQQLIKESALRILLQKLQDGALTVRFLEHFQIEKPEQLPMSKVNAAFAWIADQGGTK